MWPRVPCGLHVSIHLLSLRDIIDHLQYTLACNTQKNVSNLQRRRGTVVIASLSGSYEPFATHT